MGSHRPILVTNAADITSRRRFQPTVFATASRRKRRPRCRPRTSASPRFRSSAALPRRRTRQRRSTRAVGRGLDRRQRSLRCARRRRFRGDADARPSRQPHRAPARSERERSGLRRARPTAARTHLLLNADVDPGCASPPMQRAGTGHRPPVLLAATGELRAVSRRLVRPLAFTRVRKRAVRTASEKQQCRAVIGTAAARPIGCCSGCCLAPGAAASWVGSAGLLCAESSDDGVDRG